MPRPLCRDRAPKALGFFDERGVEAVPAAVARGELVGVAGPVPSFALVLDRRHDSGPGGRAVAVLAVCVDQVAATGFRRQPAPRLIGQLLRPTGSVAGGPRTMENVAAVIGRMSELTMSLESFPMRPAVIGLVGSTGVSDIPHLHFEVRHGGQPVDPAPYLGMV